MIPPPLSISELPRWMRDQEQRVAAVEANLQFLTNLLALSSYGVRLPPDAERDSRLRRPSRRLSWPRSYKQQGHL